MLCVDNNVKTEQCRTEPHNREMRREKTESGITRSLKTIPEVPRLLHVVIHDHTIFQKLYKARDVELCYVSMYFLFII